MVYIGSCWSGTKICNLFVLTKLKEVIKTDLSSDWKFTKYCNIRHLTQSGENYGSTILSLDVIYEINGCEKD